MSSRAHHHSTAGTSPPISQQDQWRLRAACQGIPTDFFFPEGRGRQLENARNTAKQFCRDQCPVIEQCRDAARTEKFGIWAGTDEADRGYDLRGQRSEAKRKAVANA